MSHRILVTSPTNPLVDANYLGDYDAIVLEPTWTALFGFKDAPEPGLEAERDDKVVRGIEHVLKTRGKELDQFLAAGGLLVIKARPTSGLFSRYPSATSTHVDTIRWMADAITPIAYVIALHQWPFIEGKGSEIIPREPGHAFEELLRTSTGYTARLDPQLMHFDGTTVLAESKIGDPVAAEITVGEGTAFILPSGLDATALIVRLEELLDTRDRFRSQWRLPEEIALIEAERDLLDQTRSQREVLTAKLRGFEEIRASVMKTTDVARAVAYYEAGTSATRPIKQAMVDLYKLVELLEGYYGGSEDELATSLGVPKTRFKHIKKLANQKQLDFRHATSGATEGADAAEVEQARADAKFLVQRFIERCSAEEGNRRASASSTVTTDS